MSMLSRRNFVTGSAAIYSAGMMSSLQNVHANTAPDRWLHATDYIDKTHHKIAETAARLTQNCDSDLKRAAAIFQFVRDEIKFGFSRGFWDNRASEVLASGVGYCNTKSTLFIALLRASGIPARQTFVDLHASVLGGIIDPGTPYVDHSYVEVFLNGAWVATDAYIVDTALFGPAQAKARDEALPMGYGVHSAGSSSWDGREPSFAQFNLFDPGPISTRHWGLYQDVGDFYKHAKRPWNRLNPILRASFGAFASSANRRADRLRNTNAHLARKAVE